MSNDHKKQHSTLFREALASSSIGWEISLPIIGGALIGQVIDRALNTTILFTILLLLFGAASGIYNLMRHVQRINANKTVTKARQISDEEWDAWDEEWNQDDWDDEQEEEEEL